MLWVAVEATTIVTTFLVGHRRTRTSLEASWKYIVICSVGIAMAFLGTVLVYLAALHAGGHGPHPLDWTSLVAQSHRLDPGVMRLAFALVVLGYGTKVGLVPMHSWLPDAHSQAPAPVSALMSGVLLTVAFYAILRFKVIADGALGPGVPPHPARHRRPAVAAGGGVAAAHPARLQADARLSQRRAHGPDRPGGGGRIAVWPSPPCSSTSWATAWPRACCSWRRVRSCSPRARARSSSVPALLSRRPVLGGIFGFGLVALLGFPPFSLFVSELNMLRAEFQVGLGWAAVAVLGVHGGDLRRRHVARTPSPPRPQGHGRLRLLTPALVAVPLIGGLVGCAFIGISAWPLQPLLHAAARIVAP